MLPANSLIDFATCQGFLKRDNDEQTFIEALIGFYSDRIEKECGRKFLQNRETIYLDNSKYPSRFTTSWSYWDVIELPQYPVYAINGLWIDSQSVFGDNTKVTDASVLYPEWKAGAIKLKNANIPHGANVIKVDYTYGFIPLIAHTAALDTTAALAKTDAKPLDQTLALAVMESVLWGAQRYRSRVVGERFSNFEGLNVTFEISLPQNVINMLMPYKRQDW